MSNEPLKTESEIKGAKEFLARIAKNQNEHGCWHFLSSDKTKDYVDFWVDGERFKAKRFAYELFREKIPPKLLVLSKCGNAFCINPDHQILGGQKKRKQIMYSRGWRPKRGWKQKPEIVEMLRKIHTSKVIPQEMREHLRRINLGNKHTEETKKKMSTSRIGIPVKEPARKKIAFTKQGEKNYNTRLTEKDVRKIKKLAATLNGNRRKKKGELTIRDIADKFGISQIHVINIKKGRVWKHIK